MCDRAVYLVPVGDHQFSQDSFESGCDEISWGCPEELDGLFIPGCDIDQPCAGTAWCAGNSDTAGNFSGSAPVSSSFNPGSVWTGR